MNDTLWDVLIIGGGPAGLSAALYLGRCRRKVLVIDEAKPRHMVSEAVHNFITQDGTSPQAFRQQTWSQLKHYPTIERHEAKATALHFGDDQRWRVNCGDVTLQGKAVLLATGVVDEHPKIDGYQAKWGGAIQQCPFCHGWEMRDRPIGLLSTDLSTGHMAPMLLNWSTDLMVFSHHNTFSTETKDLLAKLAIPLVETPIASLEGEGRTLQAIKLIDGQIIERQGLFVTTSQHQVPLVTPLKLELDDEGYLQTDELGATSQPMLWAAGDLTSRYQQVLEAAAKGARAAIGIHMALNP